MNAPVLDSQGHEVAFASELQIDTPRGKAMLHCTGLPPHFTKWNKEGFPIEWLGSLTWKLVYADGAVAVPNGKPSVAPSRRCASKE